VSRVLAQSVSLDYYTDVVDDRLAQMEALMEALLDRQRHVGRGRGGDGGGGGGPWGALMRLPSTLAAAFGAGNAESGRRRDDKVQQGSEQRNLWQQGQGMGSQSLTANGVPAAATSRAALQRQLLLERGGERLFHHEVQLIGSMLLTMKVSEGESESDCVWPCPK
jgi:hypothetical protein